MASFAVDQLPSIRRLEATRSRRELTLIDDDDWKNKRDGPLLSELSATHTAHTGTHYYEMQDQLKYLKDELQKKERLINQLTSFDTPRPKSVDQYKLDDLFTSDASAAEASARCELAAVQLRANSLQSQLREAQAQLEVREDKLKELRCQVECARETELRTASSMQSLRQKLVEYEAHASTLEAQAARSELVIQTLQLENRQANDRAIELETKLRVLKEEMESSCTQRTDVEKTFSVTLAKLAGLLNTSDASVDNLSSMMSQLVEERNSLKALLAALRDKDEQGSQVSRETISSLNRQLEEERSLTQKLSQESNTTRQEKEEVLIKLRSVQRELVTLTEQLEGTKRAWSESKRELQELVQHQLQSQGGHESLRQGMETARVQLRQLLEALASTFGVETREELIIERARRLMASQDESFARVEMLEQRLAGVEEQLGEERGKTKEARQVALQSQEEIAALQRRITHLKGDTSANNELRDTIQLERNRCSAILDKIRQALHLDARGEGGSEAIVEAILQRIVQLMQEAPQTEKEHKAHVKQLQQKIKAAKEQLESRDLHMDLLRKKIGSLEERLTGQSGLEHDKNEEFVKNRKLLKLVEKFKSELAEAREEIRDLKARLLESSDIRIRILEREKDFERLQIHLAEVERIREEQASKISFLRGDVDNVNREFTDRREVANNTIAALTSELKTTRTALDEIHRHEKQLLDLRRVIARMLGLDVNTLTVPDFEIISRLEHLIMASQSNASAAFSMEAILADMEGSFRKGYEDASRMMKAYERSASPHRRQRDTRARSPSKAMLD